MRPPAAFSRDTSSGGNVLQNLNTCYNGSASPCTGTAIALPIARRTVIDQAGASGVECEHDYFYSAYGLLTEQDDYDYGANIPSTPLRKTLITYAPLTNGIVSAPQTIKIEEGSGTLRSQTTYTYAQGTPVTTSTPQHVAVSGSRGNPTTIAYLVQGSTSLTKTNTYYDTGNVQTATDFNGAATSYTYGFCGNSFVSNTSKPLSLSTSAAWNCNGGVQTSATDENSHADTTSYTDAEFWRPFSTTDRTGAVTQFTYTGQNSVESVMTVSSGSAAVDVLQLFQAAQSAGAAR